MVEELFLWLVVICALCLFVYLFPFFCCFCWFPGVCMCLFICSTRGWTQGALSYVPGPFYFSVLSHGLGKLPRQSLSLWSPCLSLPDSWDYRLHHVPGWGILYILDMNSLLVLWFRNLFPLSSWPFHYHTILMNKEVRNFYAGWFIIFYRTISRQLASL